MKTPPFTLHMPTSIEETMSLVNEFTDNNEQFDWVAGGTDLLPNYKWHINVKQNVISLAKIEELHKFSTNHIGAMVRLDNLANSEKSHPLIANTAATIASVMIRKSGTVGGNICLDTRCFWFNQGEGWRESIEWCHKCDNKTGADCRVIPNQNDLCVATYQADLAAPLLALDATIHMIHPSGARSVPISEFFQEDGITRNVLRDGEMVSHVTLPEDVMEWKGEYQKLRVRESWDFPEAGVAAAWKKRGDGTIENIRIATTALESIPRLHPESRDLLENMDDSSMRKLASDIQKSVKPVNNTFLPPNYRKKMVSVLVKRALEPMLGSE
jgi:4-hydroxybenzoyl-CoA reductase subunit beta